MKFPLFFSCKHENSADNGFSLPYFNKCIILEHNALFSCYLISGIRTDLKSKYFTLGFPPLCDRWDPLGPPQIPGLLDFVVPMCIASRSTKTICYCFLYTPLGAIFYPSCVLWQTIVKKIYVGSLIFAYLSTTWLISSWKLGSKTQTHLSNHNELNHQVKCEFLLENSKIKKYTGSVFFFKWRNAYWFELKVKNWLETSKSKRYE